MFTQKSQTATPNMFGQKLVKEEEKNKENKPSDRMSTDSEETKAQASKAPNQPLSKTSNQPLIKAMIPSQQSATPAADTRHLEMDYLANKSLTEVWKIFRDEMIWQKTQHIKHSEWLQKKEEVLRAYLQDYHECTQLYLTIYRLIK